MGKVTIEHSMPLRSAYLGHRMALHTGPCGGALFGGHDRDAEKETLGGVPSHMVRVWGGLGRYFRGHSSPVEWKEARNHGGAH